MLIQYFFLLCNEKNGRKELVVGSEDFEIRIFDNEEVIAEITETEKITHLCSSKGSKYGYALANGTVGVYDFTTRVWRAKTKHSVTSLAIFDANGDGKEELVV